MNYPLLLTPCRSGETETLILRAGPPAFLVDASELAKDFVYSCLARKSHQRPSAWQLLRYPWIKVGARHPGGGE